jgi:hypothetical protein
VTGRLTGAVGGGISDDLETVIDPLQSHAKVVLFSESDKAWRESKRLPPRGERFKIAGGVVSRPVLFALLREECERELSCGFFAGALAGGTARR